MSKPFKGSQALVLAAVKPGHLDHPSVDAAAHICRRTGMRLRLIAAVEPIYETPGIFGLSKLYDFTEIGRTEDDRQKAEVESALARLADSLELKTKVEISVICGAPATSILKDAELSGASLIVSGAAKGGHNFVLKGLSTAIALMSDAPVPVLMISDACRVDFSRADLRILLADDLTEACERAALAALDLATAMGQTDVHHVYANAFSMASFAKNVQKLREMHRQDADSDIGPTDLWEKARGSLLERLRLRAPGREQFLNAAGGHYFPEIRDGSVESVLEKAIEASAPDILAFGRHQSFHSRPFAIGRVPFQFMLSQDRPILVVPPT